MRGRVNAIRTFKGLVVDLRGINDTKGGITASSQDTHDKANELQRRIKILNGWNREKHSLHRRNCMQAEWNVDAE